MKVTSPTSCTSFTPSFSSTSYPTPNTCSGDWWAHDPGLYQRISDGKYFRFATGPASTSIAPIHSLAPKKQLWAPDIHYDQATRTYHMYYIVSTFVSRNSVIGLASSPDLMPESWTDYGAVIQSTNEDRYNAIDGNWYYLLFSSGRASKYDTTLPAQGEEYKIMVCRSRSGREDFVDRSGKSGGTILLASHGSIYGHGG
ncbi:glycosyl hydrolase [Aspergillus nidulans var. acristatus]